MLNLPQIPTAVDSEIGEQDYIVSAANARNFPMSHRVFWDNEYQFNQNEYFTNGCTIFAALTAASNSLGVAWTPAEVRSIVNTALADGTLRSWGGTTSESSMFVLRKVKIKLQNNNIIRTSVVVGSDDFYDFLKDGYTLMSGGAISNAYMSDLVEDDTLDSTQFSDSMWGHSFCFTKDKNTNDIKIIDNYKGRANPSNIYTVPRKNFETLVKNRVFFSTAYAFLEVPQTFDFSSVPTWGQEAWQAMREGGYDGTPETVVGNSELEKMLIARGLLTQRWGKDMNALRLACAIHTALK